MQRPLKWCAAALCLFGIMSEGAKADFTSGNRLWDACQADEKKDPFAALFCTAYLLGAGETFQALQVANQVFLERREP